MALIDIAIARVSGTEIGIRPNSNMAKIVKARGVARTLDFRRIEELPRREWEPDEELQQDLSDFLRTSDGVMNLWAIQAAALQDVHDRGGAFLPVSVGGGKALISLLAPVVCESLRPVLFVPAALRDQTNKHVIPEMEKHWKLHPNLKVVGYSELSLVKNNNMLEELQPDLIILDECHYLKNRKAGRTKRMLRYMKAHPETHMVAMSGTVSNRSLKDYQHILRWCLGDDMCPLPTRYMELCDWADALDEGVQPQSRIAPGALEKFCNEGENARQGYRRRLTETPGVIASGSEELGVSLRLNKLTPTIEDETKSLIRQVRNNWIGPGGNDIAEAVDLWRTIRQLSLGFYYKWDPPGPRGWLDARREWKRFVRHTLAYNRRGLDTELQVWNECESILSNNIKTMLPGHSKYLQVSAWKNWRDIKDTFKPNTVPVWEDSAVTHDIKEWAQKSPGIVWVEHRALGERMQTFGFRYYGAGDNDILNEDGSRSIVASIAAHGTGKNLQMFNRNLVTCPPSSGKTWEQLLGRTHRAGQQADEVVFDIYLHEDELMGSFRKALADAVYLEDSIGGRQRLNYADILFDT